MYSVYVWNTMKSERVRRRKRQGKKKRVTSTYNLPWPCSCSVADLLSEKKKWKWKWRKGKKWFTFRICRIREKIPFVPLLTLHPLSLIQQ